MISTHFNSILWHSDTWNSFVILKINTALSQPFQFKFHLPLPYISLPPGTMSQRAITPKYRKAPPRYPPRDTVHPTACNSGCSWSDSLISDLCFWFQPVFWMHFVCCCCLLWHTNSLFHFVLLSTSWRGSPASLAQGILCHLGKLTPPFPCVMKRAQCRQIHIVQAHFVSRSSFFVLIQIWKEY